MSYFMYNNQKEHKNEKDFVRLSNVILLGNTVYYWRY